MFDFVRRTFFSAVLLVWSSAATMPGQLPNLQADSGTDLRSRVQAHLQSQQATHQQVQSLFEPLGRRSGGNQVQPVLWQISRNRERLSGEVRRLKESGRVAQIEKAIRNQMAALSAASLGEDGVELMNRLNEFLKDLENSQKQLATDLTLLEQDAKDIIATAAALSLPIALLTGPNDADEYVLKFVREQTAKGGFRMTP
jgi:hypothetical protein